MPIHGVLGDCEECVRPYKKVAIIVIADAICWAIVVTGIMFVVNLVS